MLLLAALGCGDPAAPGPEAPPVPDAQTHFDPSNAGTIRGQVTWSGGQPESRPYEILPNPLAAVLFHKKQVRPNPNLPLIDPQTHGVANAVIFLRGVEPAQSKPWDQPLVQVEQRDGAYHIRQGTADSRVGFVRQGDRIQMVSRDKFFYSLHAGGAAFFTLTFPDPDEILERRLTEPGLVELTSGAGYYWMRACLFVAVHPYYAQTDTQGRFALSQVPPGSYELICWMPNWIEERHERDSESGAITRLFYRRPVQQIQSITLKPGEGREANFTLKTTDFTR